MKITKLGATLVSASLLSLAGTVVSCGEPGEEPYVDKDPKILTGKDVIYRRKNNLTPWIPEGTETIGKFAFHSEEVNVKIPDSVKHIDDSAFSNAAIKPGFELTSSIETIGGGFWTSNVLHFYWVTR